jgi:hypothetical protein
MTITTKHTLTFLQILSWIIFVGVCIEAGSIVFKMIYTLFWQPAGPDFFWDKADLSPLYHYDRSHFIVETSYMVIVSCLKAIIFGLIIKVFYDKKISLANPFNRYVSRFIQSMAYLSFIVGVFSHCGVNYTEWLVSQGVKMPEMRHLRFDGADVWLFMGVSLLVVSQIFKRGIELQEENDLTI